MEQHPVPRNISGFQFHLVGDMTLKQFGYLVAGGGMGFLIYKMLPFPSVINFSIGGIFGLLGFAFAFLPIQERPLDRWLLLFIKSIFSPTQYIWRKEGIAPDILTRPTVIHIRVISPHQIQTRKEADDKLKAYLSTLPAKPNEIINAAEKKYIDRTLSLFGPLQPATNTVTTYSTQRFTPSSHPVVNNTGNINPNNQQNIHSYPTSITPPQPKPTITPPLTSQTTAPTLQPTNTPFQTIAAPSIPEKQGLKTDTMNNIAEITKEKQRLEAELQKLKEEFEKMKKPQMINPVLMKEKAEPTIKTFSASEVKSQIGMPVPQFPNIVSGVVKDPAKKQLPNIILTIKDKDGLPLRAIKTNKLGQFATATPLPNGAYLIEAEDPLKRFVFDIAAITLSGKIFLPIEITSKGEKELMRERLAKDLFGNYNAI